MVGTRSAGSDGTRLNLDPGGLQIIRVKVVTQ